MYDVTRWSRIAGPALAGAALVVALAVAPASAQSKAGEEPAPQRVVLDADETDTRDLSFEHMLQRYHTTYKLGPEDEVAIRVVGEPDYTIESAKVSPFGNVYHPLLGDVRVAGLTVEEATARFREELGEYIVAPRVSVALLEAHSAKVGVLGDVTKPGILTLAGPMTVLDAIAASGGVTYYGSRSDVTVLRQLGGGETRTISVDVKRIMEGKAGPLENIALQPGDTVIVHGNKKKTLSFVTSMTGFASFLTFVGR